MDYLQTIVNGFKIKNSYKKNWLPFVSILDNSKVRNNRVNQKQINKIYSLLKLHVNECKTIYAMENESREDKAERVRILKEMLVQDIESETIGFSTLHRLLFSIEDKENVQIKNLLLEILYLCGNDSFKDAIIQSSDEILQLEDDGDDISLFGIGYRVVKNKVNNSKE